MPRAIVLLLSLLLTTAPQAADRPEPGVILRAGNWDGEIGTYTVPLPLEKLSPARWPNDRWHRLVIGADRIVASEVSSAGRQRPRFLATITSQVIARGANASAAAPASDASAPPAENVVYARFPGARLRTGEIPLYRFKNGTAQLSPKLDYRYALRLGDQAFAFTVSNGLKGHSGASYGEGARYSIEYDGQTFDYNLPEYGWDSRVSAIADIDGDGKPDFLISVGGNNSGHEYLLLSSLARPGRNPPSAALHSVGC